jgi:hypothetical protein
MATYQDFKPFYDFAQLEAAVQSHFVATGDFGAPPNDTDPTKEAWTPTAGVIPIFTAFQAETFQKNRPRVAIDLQNIAPTQSPPKSIPCVDGILRTYLWRATLNLTIESDPSYPKHVALRGAVTALAEMIAPPVPSTNVNSTVGANQFLTNFLISYVQDNGQSTMVHPEEGYYHSALSYTLTFGWRLDLLPSA